ncbi:MAG: polymer-forming cytoskeletal protein [Lewinellaceae bacterium]|nr:polymer-forming cytoskeletal protein [Phaeodactylibacter sp.]MCB9346624.1 polymer-forming cytoskeletal protein [Lewinellaceae bacterium]
MFGGNNKKEASKGKSSSFMPSGTHALNSLVTGTIVEGTVKSESDIRIDGTIKGKLFCDAKVIIGPTGYVEGEIRCQNAVIEGKFEGNLHVAELLNIRETANISGEVVTNKLIVQSGATFNVTCSMGGKPVSRQGHATANSSSHSQNNPKEDSKVVKETKTAGAQ